MKTSYRWLFSISLIGMTCLQANGANEAFSDISGNKYRTAIEFLSKEGIIGGYDDGTYRPDGPVNRAEILKIALGSNKVDISNPQPNCFSDVTEDWHVSYVCTAKKLGMVEGYRDGTFKPTQEVSFVEALKIIERAYGANVPTTNPWYKGYVDEANSKNMIPLDIGSFDQKINRGQLADIMTRYLKHKDGSQKDYLNSSFGSGAADRKIDFDQLASLSNRGALHGKISIGPLCPAQDIAPDPNCQPTQQTYKDWQISVWTENKKDFVTQINPNLDGNFKLELPSGKYVIDFETKHPPAKSGSQALPITVTIARGFPVTVSIEVDTGIR